MLMESCGLLMYRNPGPEMEILLVHPGGPYWAKKDEGAWSLPKGVCGENEDKLAAAIREFREETGCTPLSPYIPLGQVRQRSSKIVHAWAFEGDGDPSVMKSNLFELEWPPKSGRKVSFPEADRAAFFDVATARVKINAGQAAFIDRLLEALAG